MSHRNEEALQHLTSTIAPEITEVNQGENDSENDLHSLTSTIAEKIKKGANKTDSFFSSACIFRVPEPLRKLKADAYTPSIIAIGPLHREDEHLQTPMQQVKMSYTEYLLSRLTAGMEDRELAEQNQFMVLQECLAEMKASIDDVKKCYAAEVTLDEEMMLVDGCFILEYLYRTFKSNRPSKELEKRDPIFGNSYNVPAINRDLLLLENQIPFFVLEKLFQLTIARIPNYLGSLLADYVQIRFGNLFTPRFLSRKQEMKRQAEGSSSTSTSAKTLCLPSDCVLSVFRTQSGTNTTAEAAKVQSGNIAHCNPKYYHILQAIHDAYIRRHEIEREKEMVSSRDFETMSSASDLVYAGVKFVPGRANNLLNSHFTEPQGLFWWYHKARFEFPPLEIDENIETRLRNLIAFEQCCPRVSGHFSGYAALMEMIVKSSKDVQLLEEAGVLSNQLGAIEVATDLFNTLSNEIVADITLTDFADAYIKATKYSKRFWPKNMAYLRRKYFDSPWTFIAFCVGFIVFVTSIVSFVRDFRKKG